MLRELRITIKVSEGQIIGGEAKDLGNMTDAIELFLHGLIEASEDNTIEIQRADVASRFSCAPSQINYVLQTRFVPERGYYVESRRGGGGYIRITKASDSQAELFRMALAQCNQQLEQRQAGHVVAMLRNEGLITERESRLIMAVMDRQALLLELPWRDQLRCSLLRAMLSTLITGEVGI